MLHIVSSFFTPVRNFFRGITPGSGLLRAAVTYKLGVFKADRLYRETGFRYYLIWDSHARQLRPLTYFQHPGRMDSYRCLRLRGKFTPMSEQQFRDGSLYYTPSRNTSRCTSPSEQRIQLQRLRRLMFPHSSLNSRN